MILIPRKKPGAKPPYYVIWKGRVLLTCPDNHVASLNDHKIDKSGQVQPSVVCPVEGCDFHEFIKLEDWK